MSRLLLVTDNPDDWAPYYPSRDVVSFEQYLGATGGRDGRRTRVINLCRNDRYLSSGYYCSLLAEARGHTVIPSLSTLNDLRSRSLFSLQLEGLDETVDKLLKNSSDTSLRVYSFFGSADHEAFSPLTRAVFERYPCPALEIRLRKRRQWQIEAIKPLALGQIKPALQEHFADALNRFSTIIWRRPRLRRQYKYDLAMLVDPEEKLPPSDRGALRRFVHAGRELGIAVKLITKRDYMRLPEFDALFVRATTAINHHTFRFAKKAQAEGLVVIDDPQSIMRCTNKVFLLDLLQRHRVPAPRALILHRNQVMDDVVAQLGLPVVLKIPDGSFSRGVVKVTSTEALQTEAAALFEQSELLLAQEYLYTEYDWRIGVLNGKALYACQYYMVRGHWQIYKHSNKRTASGGFATVPLEDAPPVVVEVALQAAAAIGDGFYGVDVKEIDGRAVVIEVNDNPSVDAGVEDKVLGKELYLTLMRNFIERIEQKRY